MIGPMIGYLSLLFILLKPVKGFLIFAIVNTSFAIILCSPRYISNIILRDIIVGICYFGQAFFAASIAFTQVIFSHFFDENSKKCENSIWYSLAFLGEIVAVLFTQILVYNLGIRWEYVNLIWHLYIVLIGILMYEYLGD